MLVVPEFVLCHGALLLLCDRDALVTVDDYYAKANLVNNVDVVQYGAVMKLFNDCHDILQSLKLYMQLNGFCIVLMIFMSLGPKVGIPKFYR